MDVIARLERSQAFVRGTDGGRPVWFSHRHRRLVHLWDIHRHHGWAFFAERLAFGTDWMATAATGGAFVRELLKILGGPDRIPGNLRREIAAVGPSCAKGVEWHAWNAPGIDNVFLGFDGSVKLEIPDRKRAAPPRGYPHSNVRDAYHDWRSLRRGAADEARQAFQHAFALDATPPPSCGERVMLADFLKRTFPERVQATDAFIAHARAMPRPHSSDMAPRRFLDLFGVDYFDAGHPPHTKATSHGAETERLRRGTTAEQTVNATFQLAGEKERRDPWGAALRDRIPHVVDAFSQALRQPLATHKPRWFSTFRAVRLERRILWRAKMNRGAPETFDALDVLDAEAEDALAAPSQKPAATEQGPTPDVHDTASAETVPDDVAEHTQRLARLAHVPSFASLITHATGDRDAAIAQWMKGGHFGLIAVLRWVSDDLTPEAAQDVWRTLWVEMDDSLSVEERSTVLVTRFDATFLAAKPPAAPRPQRSARRGTQTATPEKVELVAVDESDLRAIDALPLYAAHRLGAPAGFSGRPTPTPQQMVAFEKALHVPVPLVGLPGWTTLLIKRPEGGVKRIRVTFDAAEGTLRAESRRLQFTWGPDGETASNPISSDVPAPKAVATPALTPMQIDAFRGITGYGLPTLSGLQSGAFRTQGPLGPDTFVGVPMRFGDETKRIIAAPAYQAVWQVDGTGTITVTLTPDDKARPGRSVRISPQGKVRNGDDAVDTTVA